MSRHTKPLFRVDPGWLFIFAGLAVCAAGIMLPAQGDLEALKRQLQKLRNEETQAFARLKAHADFLDEVDRADPALFKRLAATQLNLVPEGDVPILLANTDSAPVTAWIDSTVQVDIRPAKVVTLSTLSRLANGQDRLWMLGGGIMSVFVGLMISPGPLRVRRSEHGSALAFAAAGTAVLDDPATETVEDLGSESIGYGLVEAGEDDDACAETGEFVADVIEIPATLVEGKPDVAEDTIAVLDDSSAVAGDVVEEDAPPAIADVVAEPHALQLDQSGHAHEGASDDDEAQAVSVVADDVTEPLEIESEASDDEQLPGSHGVLKFVADDDGAEPGDEYDSETIDDLNAESGYQIDDEGGDGRRPPFDDMFER